MDLMVNPVITDFRQDVNGDIKMLKIGAKKEDAYANIIGQAEGADLDNNKTATINVSTYTEPVVINPTSGKDGMKKATVTLSNIPSGVSTLYAWKLEETSFQVYTITSTPTSGDLVVSCDNQGLSISTSEVVSAGEGTITIGINTFERYSDGDISLT